MRGKQGKNQLFRVAEQKQLAPYNMLSLSVQGFPQTSQPFSAETCHILKQLCRVFMHVKVVPTN
jgi:hypothetical protein